MDVLIYVADGTVYDGIDYGTRIEDRLSAAGLTSMRCDLTNLPADQPRPELAYIFTGGGTSVYSDARWMRSAIDLAGSLAADAEPGEYSVAGICLGSQILAEALRPGSITGSKEIEVGLVPVTSALDDQVRQVVPSFHYETISPDISGVGDIKVEWRNDHTAVHAFSWGPSVFGCQFHPEFSPDDVHDLIDFNGDMITRWQGNTAAAHQSVDRYADSLPNDLFDRTLLNRLVSLKNRRSAEVGN